jgi:DNA-binding transcriptional MerR regulator
MKVLLQDKQIEAYPVGELARRLGRTSQTIRKWEKDGVLPKAGRDASGRRGYTAEQINVIVQLVHSVDYKMGTSIESTGLPELLQKEFKKRGW